VNLQNIRIFFV